MSVYDREAGLIQADIGAFLEEHEEKELLRFLTCGSVDDGKSTLIGRILHDGHLIAEDQLATLRKDTERHGTTGTALDLALLMDGLKAEREQGITIDVAYRYFATPRRKFIIADTPGHEQYTRNMVTGASNCDLAVILVDARKGVLAQTRRHSFIAALLGIPHVVVAINKMDLVEFSEDVFERIKRAYAAFAAELGTVDLHFIPMSALHGDNVVERSTRMPWYLGNPLMDHLETVHIASDRNLTDFRFPVQWVNRPHQDFRGYCGNVASGIVRRGEPVMVLPSRKVTRVASIVTADGELEEAFAPMSVTLTLQDEVDVSRGDTLAHPTNLPRLDQRFESMVVWMDEAPLLPGKSYLLKHATLTTSAAVETLRFRVDVNTLEAKPTPTLKLNEIGRCQIALARPVAFDAYDRNRETGSFILIDRLTNRTVGAGMILEQSASDTHDYWRARPRSEQLAPQSSQVTLVEREARFGQRAVTILVTGLIGSGKSTIAYALERRLFDEGRATAVLDGDNLRLGVTRDLGFLPADEAENLRRTAELAKVVNGAGLVCVCSMVAPYRELRLRMRESIGDERFIEVHLTTTPDVCRARSPRLWDLAQKGELIAFPGVTAPYDPPDDPDLALDTGALTVDDCVERVVTLLRELGVMG
jgi:bifunctional enzyme CysN/CysC